MLVIDRALPGNALHRRLCLGCAKPRRRGENAVVDLACFCSNLRFRQHAVLFRRNNMASKDVDQCSSPVKKLVRFFKKSRDGWKAKHREWKEKGKLLSNQTRAVEKSRKKWRERASAAEQRVAELERQLEELKSCCGATSHG